MTEEIRTDNSETLKNALNRIAELEKQNEELQEELKNSMNNNVKWGAELADAKQIIIRFYRYIFLREGFMELNVFNVWKNKAEAFLKE